MIRNGLRILALVVGFALMVPGILLALPGAALVGLVTKRKRGRRRQRQTERPSVRARWLGRLRDYPGTN